MIGITFGNVVNYYESMTTLIDLEKNVSFYVTIQISSLKVPRIIFTL